MGDPLGGRMIYLEGMRGNLEGAGPVQPPVPLFRSPAGAGEITRVFSFPP